MAEAAQQPTSSIRASPAAALLTFGGVAAAFGAAACCGLPLILAGLGLGTAWLGTAWLGALTPIAAAHRQLLLALAGAMLVGGATAQWRQHRAAQACRVEGVCARRGVRLLTLAGLLAGSALLLVGYLYV